MLITGLSPTLLWVPASLPQWHGSPMSVNVSVLCITFNVVVFLFPSHTIAPSTPCQLLSLQCLEDAVPSQFFTKKGASRGAVPVDLFADHHFSSYSYNINHYLSCLDNRVLADMKYQLYSESSITYVQIKLKKNCWDLEC